MPRWMRQLASVLISLILIFVVLLVVAAYQFASTALTSAPIESRSQQVDLFESSPLATRYPNVEYQNITLTTTDNLRIYTLYHPSTNGASVILLHGYRSNHSMMFPIANMLVQEGYGVILFDFRGHGLSEGQEVTFGKKEVLDVEAAYQYLSSRPEIEKDRIGLFGNSMGASTAILYAAQNPEIRAVIVQSPFASMRDVIWVNTRRSLPTPPVLLAPLVEIWVQFRLKATISSFSPINKVQEISPVPLFIMMGGQDIMTDPAGGQKLYDAAGESKELWYEDSIGHLEFQKEFPDLFEQKVLRFFEVNLK